MKVIRKNKTNNLKKKIISINFECSDGCICIDLRRYTNKKQLSSSTNVITFVFNTSAAS